MKKAILLASLCSMLVSCSTLFSNDEVATDETAKKEIATPDNSSQDPEISQAPLAPALDLDAFSGDTNSSQTSLTPQEVSAAEDQEWGEAMDENQLPTLATMKDQRISTDEMSAVQAATVANNSSLADMSPPVVEENKSYLPTPSPKSQRHSRFREVPVDRHTHHHHKQPTKTLTAKHKAKSKKSSLIAKKFKKAKLLAHHENKKSKKLAKKNTKDLCKKVAKHSKKSKREIAMCRVTQLPPKLAHRKKRLNRMTASQESSHYRE